MKRFEIIFAIFLLVASFGFVSPATSSTQLNVDVAGCEFGGEQVLPGTCFSDGRHYCDDAGNLQDTLSDVEACTMENGGFGAGSPQCCPSGYICEDQGGGNSCELRTLSCSSNTDETSCNAASCFWVDTGSETFCADKPSDFSCSVYTDPTNCVTDALNLGSTGFGAALCGDGISYSGDNFVVPQKSCACFWDTATSSCGLSYEVSPDLFLPSETPEEFTCFIDYDAGFCVDGQQSITWLGKVLTNNYPGGIVPSGLLSASTCEDGSIERTCGADIVTLPGFSSFALVASVSLLFLFYYFRREN